MFGVLSWRQAWPIAASVAIIAVTTAIIETVHVAIELQHLIFAYLIPTSFIAVRYGSVVAVLTSVVCSLCGAFFLYPPKFSIYISSPLHIAELGFFLLLAVPTAQFISVLRDGDRPREPT